MAQQKSELSIKEGAAVERLLGWGVCLDQESLALCLSILQDVKEHKQRNLNRNWEEQLYVLSEGSCIHVGRPSVKSAEVQILAKSGILSLCRRGDDPALRLLDIFEPLADELIAIYTRMCTKADVVQQPEIKE